MTRWRHLLLVAAIASAASARAAEHVTWVKGYAEGMAKAKAEQRPALLDFYADWCGWCKVMDRTTYGDASVANLLTNFVCIKIDIESDTDTAFTFRIGSLPRTILLDAEGRLLGDRIGYLEPEPFKAFLADAAQPASPDAPIAPGQERARFLAKLSDLGATAATNQAALAELVDHLDHPEASARKTARDALREAGPAAIPLLVPLLNHAQLDARIASHSLLLELAPNAPPFDPWSERAAREAALAEWEVWAARRD